MSEPVPTINVNLDTHCDAGIHCRHPGGHAPVRVPCPIPRSVTFTVRLGECTCFVGAFGYDGEHSEDCLARPIHVSCSSSGKTWMDTAPVDLKLNPMPSDAGSTYVRVLSAVQDRWARVKALVLGQHAGLPPSLEDMPPAVRRLFYERDAVFAALAVEARLEQELFDAQRRSHALVDGVLRESDGMIGAKPERRHTAAVLEAYVERLIEQVGALP